MDREEAERRTILRSIVGSELCGTNVEESSDRDEMGVCIEPLENVVGFTEFEQFIYRSAEEREGQKHVRSQQGDLDLKIYSLRKYLRLATHGNPEVLPLLFARSATKTKWGEELQNMAPWIVSRQAGKRYLGYMESQKQRLVGERGQKRTNRPELEEKYGYDTKYAMHIIRLGFQGVELLETGRLTLPMISVESDYCKAIRRGEISLDEVLNKGGLLERKLKDLIDGNSPLDKSPDMKVVEEWMLEAYRSNWNA